MPEDGIRLMNHQDILSFEEITEVVRVAVSQGIDKFRITGGEPLVRKDIVTLVSQMASVSGVKDLSITTNGILLEELAQPLKDAGLRPVNISLDTLNGRMNNLQVRFIRQMNLESGEFSVVEGGEGGNCSRCNRLRLTANGMVKPCLFDEQEFSVRELGAEKALLSALNSKPLNGCFNSKGSFYNIGG